MIMIFTLDHHNHRAGAGEQKEYVVLCDELERLMLLETERDMTDSASNTLHHARTMARMSTKDDDNFIIPFDIDVASTSNMALLYEEEDEEDDEKQEEGGEEGWTAMVPSCGTMNRWSLSIYRYYYSRQGRYKK